MGSLSRNIEYASGWRPVGSVSLTDGNVVAWEIPKLFGRIVAVQAFGDAVLATLMGGSNSAAITNVAAAQRTLDDGRVEIPVDANTAFREGLGVQITYDTSKVLRGYIMGPGGILDGTPKRIVISAPFGGPSPDLADGDPVEWLEPNVTANIGYRVNVGETSIVQIPDWVTHFGFVRVGSTNATVLISEV